MKPPETDSKLLVQFLTIWRAGPRFGHHLVLVLVLAAAVGAVFLVGAVTTRTCHFDVVGFVSNGWRVLNGQRPHVDFSSPWGPLMFLLVAAGLKLANHSVAAVGYASGAFGLLTGLWAYRLALRRLDVVPAMLAAVTVAVLAMAPCPLGYPWAMLSHAMMYNRYGYAVLSLVLIECFPSRRAEGDRRLDFWGGVSSGAACSALLFLKASYFFVALGFIVLSWCFWTHSTRRRLLGAVLGGGVLGILFLGYLKFDVLAVLRDLQMAALSRGQAISGGAVLRGFVGNWISCIQLMTVSLVIGFIYVPQASGQLTGLFRWRKLTITGAVCVADVLLYSTNCQGPCFPLSIVWALLLVSEILSGDFPLPKSQAVVLALFPFALFGQAVASDVLVIGNALRLKLLPTAAASVFERTTVPGFAPLVVEDRLDEPISARGGRAMTVLIADGIDLLQRHISAEDKVATFDVWDPFSFALRRTPPLGGHAWPTYGLLISDRHHPSPDFFFGDATLVMFHKDHAQNVFGLLRLYGKDLESRFRIVDETAHWRLYRRRSML